MNINKFINAQESLINSYEQQNYINKKIYEIQMSATNNKYALAWVTINEISGRKKSNKSKLKANNDNERIKFSIQISNIYLARISNRQFIAKIQIIH